jgi:hypothetical protein
VYVARWRRQHPQSRTEKRKNNEHANRGSSKSTQTQAQHALAGGTKPRHWDRHRVWVVCVSPPRGRSLRFPITRAPTEPVWGPRRARLRIREKLRFRHPRPHSARIRARSENESVREQDGGLGVGEVGWGRAEEGRAAEQSDLLSSPRRIINQVVRFPELQ